MGVLKPCEYCGDCTESHDSWTKCIDILIRRFHEALQVVERQDREIEQLKELAYDREHWVEHAEGDIGHLRAISEVARDVWVDNQERCHDPEMCDCSLARLHRALGAGGYQL